MGYQCYQCSFNCPRNHQRPCRHSLGARRKGVQMHEQLVRSQGAVGTSEVGPLEVPLADHGAEGDDAVDHADAPDDAEDAMGVRILDLVRSEDLKEDSELGEGSGDECLADHNLDDDALRNARERFVTGAEAASPESEAKAVEELHEAEREVILEWGLLQAIGDESGQSEQVGDGDVDDSHFSTVVAAWVSALAEVVHCSVANVAMIQ